VVELCQYIGDAKQSQRLRRLTALWAAPAGAQDCLAPLNPALSAWPTAAAERSPLIFAADSWRWMGLPLMGLLLAQGSNNPLSINLRYTLLRVPGLFYGAPEWCSRREALFKAADYGASGWVACLLSLLFT